MKASLKNNPFDEAFVNNVLYFRSKYLKQTFGRKSHEIWSIRYGHGLKYLKRIFNKSHTNKVCRRLLRTVQQEAIT